MFGHAHQTEILASLTAFACSFDSQLRLVLSFYFEALCWVLDLSMHSSCDLWSSFVNLGRWRDGTVVFSFRLSALVCVCSPHSASFATRHSLCAIAGSDSLVAF